jgi:hypothetical protein
VFICVYSWLNAQCSPRPPCRIRGGTSVFIDLLNNGLVLTNRSFSFHEEVLRHLERYSSIPMSFADACLVRMSEIERDSIVFTTDRDFLTYRRNQRQPIQLISPF